MSNWAKSTTSRQLQWATGSCMSTPTNQNAKATPLTHRDSLATEDKQREVVRTVTVPTNKCRCDGHVIAPIWPSPTLGRNCASKLSTTVLRPNGRTPWISRPTQNQPHQDPRRRYVADRQTWNSGVVRTYW